MKQQTILQYFLLAAITTLPFAGAHVFVLGVPIYMPELMVIFASAVFVCIHWRTCSSETRKLPRSILWPITLLCIGLLSSAFFNGITTVQLGIMKSWFFFPLLFGWLIFQQPKDFKRQAVLAWYATLVATAIIALGYFFQDQLTYDGRLRAFYLSPNYLTLFLFPGVFLGWHFIVKTYSNYSVIQRLMRDLERKSQESMDSRVKPEDNKYNGFLFFSATLSWIILCATVYMTLSYTVIVASIVGFFIMLFLQSKRSGFFHITVITLCTACITLFLLPQTNSQKFSDLLHLDERSSLASRIMIWQSSWKMLENQPIIGIGPGNFQSTYLEYQKYFPPYLEWAVPHPHNIYFAFWLQTGIVGLIGFMFLIIFWLRALLRNKEKTPLQWAFIGIMITFLLVGLFDTPYWKNDLAYSFWLLIVLGL